MFHSMVPSIANPLRFGKTRGAAFLPPAKNAPRPGRYCTLRAENRARGKEILHEREKFKKISHFVGTKDGFLL